MAAKRFVELSKIVLISVALINLLSLGAVSTRAVSSSEAAVGWYPMDPGGTTEVHAVASQGSNVYISTMISGYAYCATGGCPGIASWDGTKWAILGDQFDFADQVWSLAISPTGDLYAGGMIYKYNNIARWDGVKWNKVADSLGNGIDGHVFSIAFYGNDVFVSGSFTSAGDCIVGCKYLAKWDGNTFSPVAPEVNGIIYSIAVDSVGNLYAGGSFTQAGTVPAKNIAKWNGTEWSSLGTGTGTDGVVVLSIAIGSSDIVYAGGVFPRMNDLPGAQNIAVWHENTWLPLGTGITGSVDTIALDSDGQVYAGGDFSAAGSCTRYCENIAMWDGTTWQPLGTGIYGTVAGLSVSETTVYAGGHFGTAGGLFVSNVAKYVLPAKPVIFFGPAPTPTYLGGDFTVSAITNNTDSQDLTYKTISGPCNLVSGTTFHTSGAGTCIVQASSAATPNFKAGSITQSIVIAKASPAILFSPAPIVYYPGGNFTISASTSNTENVSLVYSVSSGPCVLVSGPTFSTSGAGDCEIQAGGAETANYNAVYATQIVKILPQHVTISTLGILYDPSTRMWILNLKVTTADSYKPTGVVTFKDGDTQISGCENVRLDANGEAKCEFNPLGVRVHLYTGEYGGEIAANSSVSNPIFLHSIALPYLGR